MMQREIPRAPASASPSALRRRLRPPLPPGAVWSSPSFTWAAPSPSHPFFPGKGQHQAVLSPRMPPRGAQTKPRSFPWAFLGSRERLGQLFGCCHLRGCAWVGRSFPLVPPVPTGVMTPNTTPGSVPGSRPWCVQQDGDIRLEGTRGRPSSRRPAASRGGIWPGRSCQKCPIPIPRCAGYSLSLSGCQQPVLPPPLPALLPHPRPAGTVLLLLLTGRGRAGGDSPACHCILQNRGCSARPEAFGER